MAIAIVITVTGIGKSEKNGYPLPIKKFGIQGITRLVANGYPGIGLKSRMNPDTGQKPGYGYPIDNIAIMKDFERRA